jgi:DNA-directed RNA polymerase subunit N (RpoN/RPB10)
MHCRLPVGDIAAIFNMIRYERVKEALKKAGVVPSQASADMFLQIDMSDVFEDLGVEDDCCRGSLTTAIDMREVY